jgi:prepilin-type processing-associated H-X9-DG protein
MDTNHRSDSRSSFPRREIPGHGCGAFTLTELLVVLATLAILAILFFPALAGTQPGNTKVFQCLNNMRQMAVAWTLYAEDNHDGLVNNFDIANVQTEAQNKTYRSWANDFMNWNFTDSVGNWNTNYDGITKASFYLYIKSMAIYKCPADIYLSAKQQAIGGPLSWRPRSYSMNCFVGAPKPTYTAPYNEFYTAYRQFLKLGQIPAPSGIYLMLEEHPDSINDGIFENDASPNISRWSDLPGSNHSGSAGFSFADGHAEIHKWMNTGITIQPVRYGLFSDQPFSSDPTGAAFQDGQWLAAHSSVPR